MRKAIILLLTFLSFYGKGQQLSTKGKDFWMGFMQNELGWGNLRIYISSNVNSSGNISIPGWSWSQNYTVTANSTTKIVIPSYIYTSTNQIVENNGIHITSTDSVSVFAFNYKSESSDASIIYSADFLGSEYRILSIDGWLNHMNEGYLIVATQDSSTIEITPFGGIPFIISLNAGQTYLIKSYNQLSGALVREISCKKIAIFTGVECADIECPSCDHLFEQLIPVNKFGNNFLTIPLKTKSQDFFNIISHYNNTSISINNGIPIVMTSGQVYQFSSNQPSFIQSTQPVLVFQLAQGYSCDGIGDPFSVIVPPLEYSINDITIVTIDSSNIDSNYINIITKTINTSALTVDGSTVLFSIIPANPIYSYARISVNSGNHHITSPYGFNASVYGFGPWESYGYNSGYNTNKIQYDFIINSNKLCPDDTINFITQSYPFITDYYWTFGDGGSATGLNANHAYSNFGNYTVCLFLKDDIGCIIDTVIKNIQVGIPITYLNPMICQGNLFQVGSNLYNISGMYYDTLINSKGCDSIIITNLILNYNKQTTLNPFICQGDSYFVGSHSYTSTGIFIDSLLTTMGCDSIVLTNLVVKPFPVVNLSNDTTICESTNISLNATYLNATYQWQDNSTNPVYNVTKGGLYWVKATMDSCSSLDSINIEIIDCLSFLELPNIITPNNDGYNDVFVTLKSENIKSMKTQIFNRWGGLVYETDKLNIEWDGKQNGRLLADGVYFWIINFTAVNAKQGMMKGSLTLLN